MIRCKPLLALFALVALTGCSLNTRPIGTHDPAVEIARANAEAEKARAAASVAMMQALVAALAGLAAPSPSPTPSALCLSSDGVTVVACEAIR